MFMNLVSAFFMQKKKKKNKNLADFAKLGNMFEMSSFKGGDI